MMRKTMTMLTAHHGFVRQAVRACLIVVITLSGCSTKSTVATTSGTEPGKTAQTSAPTSKAESGRAEEQALQGFSKTPTEERLAPLAPMVVAKAEPSDKTKEASGRQLADIYFAFDKWLLSEEGKKNLAESVRYLKQHPNAKLVIEGHCDERGSREYNLILGEKRAKESLRYLTALGITNSSSITSYGKEHPVCTEPNESCYWKNRRAHLVVMDGRL